MDRRYDPEPRTTLTPPPPRTPLSGTEDPNVASREADLVVERAIRDFQRQKEAEERKKRGLFGLRRPSRSLDGDDGSPEAGYSIPLSTPLSPPRPAATRPTAPPPTTPPVAPPLAFSPGKSGRSPDSGASREAEIVVNRAISEFERQNRRPERYRLVRFFLRLFRRAGGSAAPDDGFTLTPENAVLPGGATLPPQPEPPLPKPSPWQRRRASRREQEASRKQSAPADAAAHDQVAPAPEPLPAIFRGKNGPILSREAEIVVLRAIALFQEMKRAQQERASRFGKLLWALGLMVRPLKIGLFFGLIALVLLLWDGTRQERKELSARFAAVEGKVNVQKRVEQKVVKATLKVPLLNRDVDVTGPNGQAVMVFPDGSAIHQSPSTRFEVRLLDYARSGRRDRCFFLRYGTIFTRISRRFGANGQTLITTPNAVAAARGTGFTVRHIRPRRITFVEVAHGTVIFRNVGGSLAVPAGQRAVAIGDNPPFLLGMDGALFRRIATQYRRLGVFELDPGYTLPEDLFLQAGGNAAATAAAAATPPAVTIAQALDAALASAGDSRTTNVNAGIPAAPASADEAKRGLPENTNYAWLVALDSDSQAAGGNDSAGTSVAATSRRQRGNGTTTGNTDSRVAEAATQAAAEVRRRQLDGDSPEEPLKIPGLPKVGGDGLAALLKQHTHEIEKKALRATDPFLEKVGLTVHGWNFNATNAARRAACVQALHRIQESLLSRAGAEAPTHVNLVTLDGAGLDSKMKDRVQEALGGSVLESYRRDTEKGYVVRARARDDQGTLYELTEAGVRLIPEARNAGKVRIEEQDDLTPGAEKMKADLENRLKKTKAH